MMILCDFHVSVHLADKVWQYSVGPKKSGVVKFFYNLQEHNCKEDKKTIARTQKEVNFSRENKHAPVRGLHLAPKSSVCNEKTRQIATVLKKKTAYQ